MVFYPPSWVPNLPYDPPDSITIGQFMRSEAHGRCPIEKSRNPFTCGLTGKTYTTSQSFERTDLIARALSKIMGWRPNSESPWDKVISVFSCNNIDYIPVCHSVHQLGGITSPANVAYSAVELAHQLKSSSSRVLFTCATVLDTAWKASREAGIPKDRIFLFEVPGMPTPPGFKTVDDLVELGRSVPELEPLRWVKGQGARQVAFLCYSSGTSGFPKAVMISHRNVIANTLQISHYEGPGRKHFGVTQRVSMGVLPMSHIYGLMVVAHAAPFRGDESICLPKFDLIDFLKAIQTFKIAMLPVVPPIIVRMLSSQVECERYDISSVTTVYTGAAPLGKETVEELLKIYPGWRVLQGYGMTETSTVVVTTSEHDIFLGSSGSLVPGARAKLVDPEGKEITTYNTFGELLVQSPSVTMGYLNNEKATGETFVWDEDGRWIRTGDEVIVTKAPSGNEHFTIVDRIKELIKVKGHQVAPAELEAHLLSHEFVDDVAVIQVPHEQDGEVPKAFVVKSPMARSKSDDEVRAAVLKHVEEHKARYKWLKGGVIFIENVPKSPSGKILRRLLRDQETEARRRTASKL